MAHLISLSPPNWYHFLSHLTPFVGPPNVTSWPYLHYLEVHRTSLFYDPPNTIYWFTSSHFLTHLNLMSFSGTPYITHLTLLCGPPYGTLWPTLRHFVTHLTALCGPPYGTLWPTLRHFVTHITALCGPPLRHSVAHRATHYGTPYVTLWHTLRHFVACLTALVGSSYGTLRPISVTHMRITAE